MIAKAGDRVRVLADEGEFTGILMPRPEILEQDATIVKLDSGYNIGICNHKIKKMEILEAYKPEKETKPKIKHNPKLPTVAILSTGGTISSKIDYRSGGTSADYTAEDFVEMLPELQDIANIKAKKIMSAMTEDFTYKEWAEMAESVVKEINDADGIVLTMGTDTLHIASAALSFLLKEIGKPVVITAAQRSIDRGSTDAFMNLLCAVNAAAKIDASGVFTCMHGTINDDYCLLIRGTKVRKMHTSRRDAFRPINEMPIAKVFYGGRIEIINKNVMQRDGKLKAYFDNQFEEKVALVLVYPGMEPGVIDFYVEKGYKGIVLSATALGHVPTENSKSNILPNIKKATDKGVSVVIASQTIYGRVHPLVYTNLRKLSITLGCIFVEDMLPETAYVKLCHVLGHANKKDEIKKMMLSSIAGEITRRSSPEEFLY